MRPFNSIFSIIMIFAMVGACTTKDELTKPTVVEFEFTMNVESEEGKFVKFSQGILSFDALEFDGDRETGQDFYFLSEFDDLVVVDLDMQVASEVVAYDVPQGIYNRIKLRLGVEGLSGGPSIRYEGLYESARDGDIPVLIEFSENDPIEMTAIGPAASNEVVLSQGTPTKAELNFDPLSLFQFANSRQLESADISIVDGEQVIIISEENNTTIFNQIVSRLEKSVTATFN